MRPRESRRAYLRVGPDLAAALEVWGTRSGPAHCVEVPTDVFVTDQPPRITVQLDVAGVDPDSIAVALEGDALVVRGERVPPRGGRRRYQQAEIEWGPFERRVLLTAPVDPARAEAQYERGLLIISLPVAERAPVEPPLVVVEVHTVRR